jgi:hypothetical protein
MSRAELDRRLAEADRAIVLLRRATLDLRALGRDLLRTRPRHEDLHDRPDGPHRDAPPGRSGAA